MKDARYYDADGHPHTVGIKFSYMRYDIRVDGEHHAWADDRDDVDDAVRELVTYKCWTSTKPRKSKKKTPPKSLTATGEV